MTKPSFVYVTYIVTTPQKVWEAITDANISASYWQRSNVSDWQVGSPWEHKFLDRPADVVGTVLESDPPRRLVTSWASPAHAHDPDRVSRCAFDIDDLGDKVRLTITHTELTEQGLRDVSAGWPAVLANLKTMLETGATMPDAFSGVQNHNHPQR